MPRQVNRYVTAPTTAILGTQMERNRFVKDMWIGQLGGKCAGCGEKYEKKIISKKFNSRLSKKVEISNLDAHYTGNDREGHKKFQLGKLQVSMKDDYSIQKSYLNNCIENLCPCKLLCKRCHGELHRKESGKCMRMRTIHECLNSLRPYGQHT